MYSLYSDVIETINKWREESWADVSVESLNLMEENFTSYTAYCGTLPRDLREWYAYKELK